MSQDLINAFFEGMAGLMVLNHCRVLLRERCVRGVSLLAVLFFTIWGGWNLYYYPALGQVWSGACAVLVTVSNSLYLVLAWRFRRQEQRPQYFWEVVLK